MRTILEIRFIARSPKTKPTYQSKCWDFPSKKEAKKFVKTAYLDGYFIDQALFLSWNSRKKCFKNELK